MLFSSLICIDHIHLVRLYDIEFFFVKQKHIALVAKDEYKGHYRTKNTRKITETNKRNEEIVTVGYRNRLRKFWKIHHQVPAQKEYDLCFLHQIVGAKDWSK